MPWGTGRADGTDRLPVIGRPDVADVAAEADGELARHRSDTSAARHGGCAHGSSNCRHSVPSQAEIPSDSLSV